MGIVNATPDSFYGGGKSVETLVAQAIAMEKDGADFIDIGGESTRPGAEKIGIEEELDRVIPVIQELKSKVSIPISIDTYNPEVAKAAIDHGAALINDITGLENPSMQKLAAATGVTVCVMHMQGTPKDMQINPVYPNGILPDLVEWFEKRISLLLKNGISEDQIILDPGIGFGKTVAHNHEILHNLHKLKAIGFPLLIGLSRKSLIGKLLGKPPESLLAATIALNTWAILNQVDVIRVHDVKEHRDVLDILYKAEYVGKGWASTI